MAKIRVWQRVAKGFFNSLGIGLLAFVVALIGVTGVNMLSLHFDIITMAQYPEAMNGYVAVPPLHGVAIGLIVLFAFLAGGIGMELSKDVDDTAVSTGA